MVKLQQESQIRANIILATNGIFLNGGMHFCYYPINMQEEL